MEFKYHNFTIEVKDFDAEYASIIDALSTYMWEENYEDYSQYMSSRKEDFEAEDEIQHEEYNSSYNILFGMECAEQDYCNMLDQERDWILDRWKKRFYSISEEKAPHKRKNALTGRL